MIHFVFIPNCSCNGHAGENVIRNGKYGIEWTMTWLQENRNYADIIGIIHSQHQDIQQKAVSGRKKASGIGQHLDDKFFEDQRHEQNTIRKDGRIYQFRLLVVNRWPLRNNEEMNMTLISWIALSLLEMNMERVEVGTHSVQLDLLST
ncbi:hypothetical protein CHS0354_042523 [Potamilus streckersoni]|uniref:Uncharacterized protein n=1 Tax=Potamilus streckersoni TaxID=2493646 RepID=A0AAE0TE25_9BIVA|nr:hypothetical protein CHS0354_042523 [Potamilus streckersoni]